MDTQINNYLKPEVKEETTDVAAMSTLLTLQNACRELKDDVILDSNTNNSLD